MTANNITRPSIASNNKNGRTGNGFWMLNAAAESFISRMSCGIIIGKPSIAMIAAFCCALAAMAAKKVNTRLRLRPPVKTSSKNGKKANPGFPKNKVNNRKLALLIRSISNALNNNLDRIKCCGLAILW